MQLIHFSLPIFFHIVPKRNATPWKYPRAFTLVVVSRTRAKCGFSKTCFYPRKTRLRESTRQFTSFLYKYFPGAHLYIRRKIQLMWLQWEWAVHAFPTFPTSAHLKINVAALWKPQQTTHQPHCCCCRKKKFRDDKVKSGNKNKTRETGKIYGLLLQRYIFCYYYWHWLCGFLYVDKKEEGRKEDLNCQESDYSSRRAVALE